MFCCCNLGGKKKKTTRKRKKRGGELKKSRQKSSLSMWYLHPEELWDSGHISVFLCLVVADGTFLSIAAFLGNKASYFQIFLSSHYILENTESSVSAYILASVQQKTLQDAVWVDRRSRGKKCFDF